MFTGIVEQVGEVVSVAPSADGSRIVVSARNLDDVPLGASIALSGVCLTAVEVNSDTVAVDVVPETLSRTTLGALEQGSQVNVELAMPATGRFDGHIVQGHVDGAGTITGFDRGEDGSVTMAVELEDSLIRYLVEKGSVAVDGVSLTVASIGKSTFHVALIPHTLEVTTLGTRSVGDRVNIEVDVLAKYVERIVRTNE